MKGNKLQKLCADVGKGLNVELATFAPVVEFLQGAGQNQLIEQVSVAFG